jgi:hypothetical protein
MSGLLLLLLVSWMYSTNMDVRSLLKIVISCFWNLFLTINKREVVLHMPQNVLSLVQVHQCIKVGTMVTKYV